MTIYERTMVTKKFHYIPYWLTVGVLLFAQQELIAKIFKETELLPIRILVSFYVSVSAIFMINLKNIFVHVIEQIGELFEFPGSQDSWLENKINEFGSPEKFSIATRVYFVVFHLGFTITVLSLGIPYKSWVSDIDFLITLQFFLFTSAHMVYGVAILLKILAEIVNFPLKRMPFYFSRHPGILVLARFYSRASLYSLAIVIILALCVWFNPYGLFSALIFWWLFTSVIPIILFIWTFIQSHTLMLRIRDKSLSLISQQIQECLDLVQKGASKDDVERLAKLMGIQDMASEMSIYPVGIEGATTFIVTFFYPVVNIAFTIYGMQ